MLRLIVLFLTIVLTMAFGQHAGDAAPDIVYTRIVHAPSGAGWSPASLSGQLSVLLCFPDTSHNLQAVEQWNGLIDRFAGQPVQFVWITGEADATLVPWLEQHPLKGWVFQDPSNATGKVYGMETPQMVIVGRDRRILGFEMAFVPPRQTIQAALDGRKLSLHSEPQRLPQPEDHRPDFPPSYTLHVSPAKSENGGDFASDDYKSLRHYTLKQVIGELYHVNPVRILLPTSLDDGRYYDFDIVLPAREGQENLANRMRQGVQDYFRIAIASQTRTLDAYVVTAPDGKPPAVQPMEAFTNFSVSFEVRHPRRQPVAMPAAISLDDIRGIEIDGTTDEFCHRLENNLDRPVVNETGLQGDFAFHVKAAPAAANNFLEVLRKELGLVIIRAPRSVEILDVRPQP